MNNYMQATVVLSTRLAKTFNAYFICRRNNKFLVNYHSLAGAYVCSSAIAAG